jgi:hypothetical protein
VIGTTYTAGTVSRDREMIGEEDNGFGIARREQGSIKRVAVGAVAGSANQGLS